MGWVRLQKWWKFNELIKVCPNNSDKYRIVPLVAAYMDPTFTADITPQTEDTNTMFPANEAFRRGCESWLKW
jgi:hypothetical protein